MLSCVIYAMDNRDVATNDTPGSFIHNNTEGTVQVRLYDILTEMLLKVDPEKYRNKVVIERGKKVIFTDLKRALYGTLVRYLLFWRDLVWKLK